MGEQTAVPCAALCPADHATEQTLPLCLFLHGGGGDRETLAGLRPLFEQGWRTGTLAPMVVATLSAGELSFYLEHGAGDRRWESFIEQALLPHLRQRYAISETLLFGISMGGFGALKMAFAHPERYVAVAAMQPMIEPTLCSGESPPRNRYYLGPNDLVGPERDTALFEANNPARRAQQNADAIRQQPLAIFIEAGDQDALCAHDGAEFLHRLLWDLDIPHEYRLHLGADHVGPTLLPRILAALQWLQTQRASADKPLAADEIAWSQWLENGAHGPPPQAALAPTSEIMRQLLRHQIADRRAQAAALDPTTHRNFGRLPGANDQA